jgi:hypothetical protein
MIFAIDPGPTESAYVRYYPELGGAVGTFGKVDNNELRGILYGESASTNWAIEMVACYGMAVGKEVFETARWVGRFQEIVERPPTKVTLIYRHDVKMILCGNMRAKDANIRQAIIDKFGGSTAIGKKKTPGPLYGVSGDVWAALAVAITYSEMHK